MTQEGEIVCGWRFVGLQRFFQQGALWGRTASLACLFQHQQLGVAVSPLTFGWHGWVVAGRQAGSVSRQRTRSDQPVITTVSTLPWSLRPKKNNKSTALTIFHREWNFNVFKQRRHAAGGYNPADISDTEDQKVATTTRKPQRRSSRCFFFSTLGGKDGIRLEKKLRGRGLRSEQRSSFLVRVLNIFGVVYVNLPQRKHGCNAG